jgi:hypothetical protein
LPESLGFNRVLSFCSGTLFLNITSFTFAAYLM